MFYFLTYSCMCVNVWGSQPTHSHSICWFGIIPREPPGSILISTECQYTCDSLHWKLLLFPWSYSLITWRFSLSQLSELSEVAQSCLTLCNPMDCRLPGSSIHGIFQSRILEWVAISFSRGSSQGSNPGLLHCRADTLQSEPTGKSSQLT